MRIAFDLHGVLDKYPKRFKLLIGHLFFDNRIIIVSGPPKKQISKELYNLGFFGYYHRIFSIVDWLKSKDVPMQQHKDGSWYCHDRAWWKSKANICKEYNIKMLYDDNLEYKRHMDQTKTIFCHVT